jgi:protocadherin-15
VNVLEERHRMVLVLADARPERVKGAEARLVTILEAQSGLVVGVERVAARAYLAENNSLQADPAATDVWFYAVDPDTGAVLERNSSRVQRCVYLYKKFPFFFVYCFI